MAKVPRNFCLDVIRSVRTLDKAAIKVPDGELVMDILRHVPEVEVVEPVGLRVTVREKLLAAVHRMAP